MRVALKSLLTTHPPGRPRSDAVSTRFLFAHRLSGVPSFSCASCSLLTSRSLDPRQRRQRANFNAPPPGSDGRPQQRQLRPGSGCRQRMARRLGPS